MKKMKRNVVIEEVFAFINESTSWGYVEDMILYGNKGLHDMSNEELSEEHNLCFNEVIEVID